MVGTSPRVLIASARNLWLHVARASALEFETTIANCDTADVISPVPASQPAPVAWLNEKAKRRMGVSYAPNTVKVEPGVVRKDYEIFFVNLPGLNFTHVLEGVQGWRERCRFAVCWIDEVWRTDLEDPRRLEALRHFDLIVLATHGSVAGMQPHVEGKVMCSPFGIDTALFCPLPDQRQRVIDLYWMGGRRSPTMHEALVEYGREHPFFYLYETTRVGMPIVPLNEHREVLATMAKRSKAFIAYRAKIDKPEQTQGQVEIGTRYFEAAAAGCVLIGEPAKNPKFKECFDWEQMGFTVPFGDPSVVEAVKRIEAEPERVAQMRRYGVSRCLEAHDWIHRWQQVVLRAADLQLHPKGQARLDRLQALREQVLKAEL